MATRYRGRGVFKSASLAVALIVVYAACLLAASVVGAGLVLLIMGVTGLVNTRRERMEQARYFQPAADDDLGNDWPWRDRA